MKFMEHRIADQRMLRLLKKWLRAGVSEDGEWFHESEHQERYFTAYANVFLHYVLDLWINDWRTPAKVKSSLCATQTTL